MANKYVLNSFRGGISDYADKGISGAFKFGSSLDIRKQVDSLTCMQDLVDEGLISSSSPSLSESPSSSLSYSPSASTSPSTSISASPSATASYSFSFSPSTSISASPSATGSYSDSPSPSPSPGITSVFRDLPKWFVKASDGYTYAFGNTGYIYRRDGDGFWMQVYKDSLGQIKGAGEKPSSSGKSYIYFATDKVLKRKPLPGRSDWNDVEIVAQNLNSADYHTMKQVNGTLVICNRSWLAYVGYDDSYTNEALDIIPGRYSKTLVERDGKVIIGTYKASDPDNGINCAIDCENPIVQIGNNGELFYADMTSSIAIKSFPGGGQVNPGGVCNQIEQTELYQWEDTSLSWEDKQTFGNIALFAVYNADTGYGGIYSYGRKNKNHPLVLNCDQQFDADELGAIENVDGTTLVSYRDGTDFGVKAVDPDNKATGTYIGLDSKAPVKNKGLMQITGYKQAEVFCSPLVSGTSIEFWYKLDKTGSWIQAKTEDGSTSFSKVGEKRGVFFIQEEAQIFEPKLILNPTGNTSPEVYKTFIYSE